MGTKSKYQRIFLIFNSEDIGYGVGQEPSGFVKIEVNEGKGKLLASVQNLNENRVLNYNLYLIKTGDDSFKYILAGTIPMNRNRGELKLDIDPQNSAGSGIPVDEFNIAAVIGEDKKEKFVNCPLVAYKKGKLSWREKLRTALNKANEVKPEAGNPNPVKEERSLKAAPKAVEPIKSVTENTQELEYKEEFTKKAATPPPEGNTSLGLAADNNGMNISNTDEIEKKEGKAEFKIQEEVVEEAPMTVAEDSKAVKNVLGETEAQKNIQVDTNEVKPKTLNMETNKTDENVNTNENNEAEIKQDDFDEYKQMLRELAAREKQGLQNDSRTGCLSANQGFCTPIQKAGEMSPCQNCKLYKADRSQPAQAASRTGNMEKLRTCLDKFFESYDPFRSRRRDYRWWKVGSPVQLNNVLYQCDIKTPLLFNPALMMAHFKYRHIIVGIYSDGARRREYIVCGIPGVYNVDEKPFGNMCRWVQVEGNRPRYGAFGYWLVYIDGRTGKFLSVN